MYNAEPAAATGRAPRAVEQHTVARRNANPLHTQAPQSSN